MNRYRDINPFDGELEVVATLSGAAIRASLDDLRAQDKLTLALRSMMRMGVSVDALSAETGLTPEAIRTRVARDLTFGEDLDALSGIVR